MILGFVAVHPLINFIAILGIVLSPKILPQKNLIIFSPFNVRKIGPKKLCFGAMSLYSRFFNILRILTCGYCSKF